MQGFILFGCFAVSIWLILFFLWYLTWPTAQARVTGVNQGTSKGLGINRPRKYRYVHYVYTYNDLEQISNRQGLIAARAFGSHLYVGDEFKVRVCRSMLSLSCPDRVGFEATVLVLTVFLLMVFGVGIYLLSSV